MKRIFLLLCVVVISLLLTSCFFGVNFAAGRKTPADQANTKWVSENPNIYFEVREEGLIYGEITIDGVTTEIIVSPMGAGGNNVTFSDKSAYSVNEYGDEWVKSEGDLFIGRYKCSEDKFVVTVFNNDKGFLPKSVKIITFIKEDMDVEENSDKIMAG